MEPWIAVLLFVAGVAGGFLNIVAGGGSMLTLPVMAMLGLPGPAVNGTNRIAILAQNVTAVATFFRNGHRNLRLSVSLSLAALPGAILGAMAGTRLEGERFDQVLAVVMLITLGLMAFEGKPPEEASAAQPPGRGRWLAGHVCMLGVGLWGGFIQVGVGFIIMPVLHRILGLDLVQTNMHKVFIVLVYTLAAIAIFQAGNHVIWSLGLVLAAGNAIGGWLGVRFAIGPGRRYLRGVFVVIVLCFSLSLVLF